MKKDPMKERLLEMGRRLSLSRRMQQISQVDLCSQTGISRSTLSNIEAGSGTVAMEAWLKVVEALGLETSLDSFGEIHYSAANMAAAEATVAKKRVSAAARRALTRL